MKCSSCGFENPDLSKFCNNCGAKTEIQGKACPNPECRRSGLPEEAVFCPDCGTAINKTSSESDHDNHLTSKPHITSFTETINGLRFEMIEIESGTFLMGCDFRNENQRPEHEVTISKFYIGKHPVTVDLFNLFINESNYKTEAERKGFSKTYSYLYWDENKGINWKYGADGKVRPQSDFCHPVIHISWNDALEFCQWLKRKTGRNYRLPTEAEWEFAARGGKFSKGYIFIGGNDAESVGWHGENGDKNTHPVGKKLPNELGLFDMSGNVSEWCSDWYGLYTNVSQLDPPGPPWGEFRVHRGNSWNAKCWGVDLSHLTASDRGRHFPGNSCDVIGFRLAMNID